MHQTDWTIWELVKNKCICWPNCFDIDHLQHTNTLVRTCKHHLVKSIQSTIREKKKLDLKKQKNSSYNSKQTVIGLIYLSGLFASSQYWFLNEIKKKKTVWVVLKLGSTRMTMEPLNRIDHLFMYMYI